MASGPITSWQIDGETMETVRDFILGGSKSTADGDCSHEIKRCLLLGRKAMTNLDDILKSQRHYFVNKGPSSQGYVLSPCLFNSYTEHIMWNARLDEVQAGIKIAGRNINNLIYAHDTTFIEESEKELKSPLMKVKEESEKACLKLNIKKLRSWHLVPSLHGK